MKAAKKIKLEEKKKVQVNSVVKELLIEEGKDLNISLPSDLLQTSIINISNSYENLCLQSANFCSLFLIADNENDKKENKKPMSLDNVNNSIESVIKSSKVLPDKKVLDEKNVAAAAAPVTVELINVDNVNNNLSSTSSKQGDYNIFKIMLVYLTLLVPFLENAVHSDLENSADETPKLEFEIVKLPENLPNDILLLIDKIKESSTNTSEGKIKFFSGPVSDMLLQ